MKVKTTDLRDGDIVIEGKHRYYVIAMQQIIEDFSEVDFEWEFDGLRTPLSTSIENDVIHEVIREEVIADLGD